MNADPNWFMKIPMVLPVPATAVHPEYVPPPELTMGQRYALLLSRRSKAVDGLASTIIGTLQAMGVPEPSEDDWRSVKAANLVSRYDGLLTPSGMSKAQALCLEMARQYGIHFVWHGRTNGNYGPFVRRTCGWNTYAADKRTAALTLSRYAATHLKQAEDGTLPAAFVLPRFTAEAVEAVA